MENIRGLVGLEHIVAYILRESGRDIPKGEMETLLKQITKLVPTVRDLWTEKMLNTTIFRKQDYPGTPCITSKEKETVDWIFNNFCKPQAG